LERVHGVSRDRLAEKQQCIQGTITESREIEELSIDTAIDPGFLDITMVFVKAFNSFALYIEGSLGSKSVPHHHS
jgi:hypothetical protein